MAAGILVPKSPTAVPAPVTIAYAAANSNCLCTMDRVHATAPLKQEEVNSLSPSKQTEEEDDDEDLFGGDEDEEEESSPQSSSGEPRDGSIPGVSPLSSSTSLSASVARNEERTKSADSSLGQTEPSALKSESVTLTAATNPSFLSSSSSTVTTHFSPHDNTETPHVPHHSQAISDTSGGVVNLVTEQQSIPVQNPTPAPTASSNTDAQVPSSLSGPVPRSLPVADPSIPTASADDIDDSFTVPRKRPVDHGNQKKESLSAAAASKYSPGTRYGLAASVKIPQSVDPKLLEGSILAKLKSLPPNLANDALQEYDDALEVKGGSIRNQGAYLYGVIKRYVSVQERATGGEGPAILPMGEGLTPVVNARLDTLVTSGFCTLEEMNEKVKSKIRMLSEKDALFAIDELSSAERNTIRNFGSYFMGILNRYMRGDTGVRAAEAAARANRFDRTNHPPPFHHHQQQPPNHPPGMANRSPHMPGGRPNNNDRNFRERNPPQNMRDRSRDRFENNDRFRYGGGDGNDRGPPPGRADPYGNKNMRPWQQQPPQQQNPMGYNQQPPMGSNNGPGNHPGGNMGAIPPPPPPPMGGNNGNQYMPPQQQQPQGIPPPLHQQQQQPYNQYGNQGFASNSNSMQPPMGRNMAPPPQQQQPFQQQQQQQHRTPPMGQQPPPQSYNNNNNMQQQPPPNNNFQQPPQQRPPMMGNPPGPKQQQQLYPMGNHPPQQQQQPPSFVPPPQQQQQQQSFNSMGALPPPRQMDPPHQQSQQPPPQAPGDFASNSYSQWQQPPLQQQQPPPHNPPNQQVPVDILALADKASSALANQNKMNAPPPHLAPPSYPSSNNNPPVLPSSVSGHSRPPPSAPSFANHPNSGVPNSFGPPHAAGGMGFPHQNVNHARPSNMHSNNNSARPPRHTTATMQDLPTSVQYAVQVSS